METAKQAIGTFLGLSPLEMELLVNDIKRKVLPTLIFGLRLLFICSFIYCIVIYTTVGFVILVFGYYIIQLERKVEDLETKLKHYDEQQYF